MKRKLITSGICLLVLSFAAIALAPAPSTYGSELDTLRATSKAFSAVAKKAVPAVVFIKVEKTIEAGSAEAPSQFNDPYDFFGDEFFNRFFRDRTPRQPQQYHQVGQGSGFIISDDGYILTNNHVAGDADVITVKLDDGREFNAKLIGSDQKADVAVIKIDAKGLPTLPLGDSDSLETGEWVIAIGNPFGLSETLTFGIVSAKGRSTVGIADYEDFIQTDAAINPGNSGGPLINLDGQAVGINTAIFSSSGGSVGIGFAIPINMVKSIKDQLIKEGKVTRGQLGVMIGELTQELADYFKLGSTKGALINEVVEGSPAQKAGLTAGDIILKLNGRDVESVGQLRNSIAAIAPGTNVSLLVYHDGKQKTVTVKLGELSEASAPAETSQMSTKLGLTVQNITEDMVRLYGLRSNEGVVVSGVAPNSYAFRAGIRPGTLILSVNQKKITSVEEFYKAVQSPSETKKVLLLIRDQNGTRFVAIPLE
jgi:serine protease Do